MSAGNAHILWGSNADVTGDTWINLSAAPGSVVTYLDATGEDGLAKMVNDLMNGPITITLGPSGAALNLSTAAFYGVENSESPTFLPRPRLLIETDLIPEPASLALLGLGALMIGRRRR